MWITKMGLQDIKETSTSVSTHFLMADHSEMSLVEAIENRIPDRAALAAKLLIQHREVIVGEVSVQNIMHGMRGLASILWEVSETSALGVKYHGKTIQELSEELPKWPGSTEMSPEAVTWFLYTARVPSESQLKAFAADIASRKLSSAAEAFCDALPRTIPSESQIIMVLAFLSGSSQFSAALAKGVRKEDIWKHTLEDALDFMAMFPAIVARVYTNIHGIERQGTLSDADLAQNFARQIGRGEDTDFIEFIRLSWSLFQDHGANVSAHAMRPLHAKAISDSMNFNLGMLSALGPDASKAEITAYARKHLLAGKIIPGYGHALLRVVDPRLVIMERFLDNHPSADPKARPFLHLIRLASTVVPDLLKGRATNPHPNADALSGSILFAYGMKADFLLSFFACSRVMGSLAQQVWDRALGLAMERPLSVTMDELLLKVQSPKQDVVARTSPTTALMLSFTGNYVFVVRRWVKLWLWKTRMVMGR
ncbi:unnamed protein product [Mycena citricolor]|uniref:Citrate synthase n=1 Tax=Mycena citricolor TaxID=2018698 RepID=A0AAD2HX23_9AGAR|nr:unnamed protein product [Mycena citricolor]